MYYKKRNINIAIIIVSVLFSGIFSSVYFLNKYADKLFENKKEVISLKFEKVNNIPRDLKYEFPRPGNSPYFTSTTILSKKELDKLESKAKKIIIYRLAGNWYKIYFNNVLIGTMGDIDNNRSDIWNNLGVFNIPENIITNNNNIRIESYNEYEFGLLGYPIIITTNKQSIKIQNWIYMVFFGINLIIMGILIILSILLTILSLFTDYNFKKINSSYLIYALAMLIMGLTSFDHIQTNILFFPLLTYKKLITFGYYSSTILICIAISYKFKSNLLKISEFILSISIIYLIIVPKTVIELKIAYNMTNYLIIMTIFIWIYITSKNFKKSVYAKLLFTGSCSQVFFACYDLINFAIGNSFNNVYAYGLFVFSISILGVVLLDLIKIMSTLEFEQKRSEILYQRSIRDGMTKVFNHQYLHSILKESKSEYTLAIIDIDDFKNINDTYGHQIGDMVIKKVAKICKNNIDKNSLVGRYGGDEFMIILFNHDENSALDISYKIKSQIETPFIFDNKEINILISIGLFSSKNESNYEKVLTMADRGLYQAKKTGKSKIVVLN